MELENKTNGVDSHQLYGYSPEQGKTRLFFDECKSGLVLKKGDLEVAVNVKPCFPWTAPSLYLSLLDNGGKTVRIVESFDELEKTEVEALTKAMRQSGFLFEVTQVFSIDEEFELRHWHVETAQGLRTLQTSVEEWPRSLPDGSFLLEDVAGDLYVLKRNVLCHPKASGAFEALLD